MFLPLVVFAVSFFGVSIHMYDTQNPTGYDSLAGCQARLYEMVNLTRQMPVSVKVLSAKCSRK